MSQKIADAFTGISDKLLNKRTTVAVNASADQIQAFIDGHIVVLGLHSLRCSVITKSNNTAVTLSPVSIDLPSFKQDIGTTFSIFSAEETVKSTFGSLVVDDGELFQLSTVHNCDFDSIKDILPKYIEVLENVKIRTTRHSIKVNDAMVDDALTNLKDALLQYEALM